MYFAVIHSVMGFSSYCAVQRLQTSPLASPARILQLGTSSIGKPNCACLEVQVGVHLPILHVLVCDDNWVPRSSAADSETGECIAAYLSPIWAQSGLTSELHWLSYFLSIPPIISHVHSHIAPDGAGPGTRKDLSPVTNRRAGFMKSTVSDHERKGVARPLPTADTYRYIPYIPLSPTPYLISDRPPDETVLKDTSHCHGIWMYFGMRTNLVGICFHIS